MSLGNRVFGLDVLRAVAVLSIVYGHGYRYAKETIPDHLYNLPSFDGVNIFFVLSGFLIGRILLRTVSSNQFNGRTLFGFWIRRWFRTLPTYFLVLTLLTVAFVFLDRPLPASLKLYFLFSQNIVSPHPTFFPEAWSLTVEEWFYLCIPIPIYLSSKVSDLNQRRVMVLWMLTIIIASSAFRIYRVHRFGYETVPEWDLALRKQVVPRLDSLMFGVAGAYLSLYRPELWRDRAAAACAAGIVLHLLDRTIVLFTANMFYYNYLHLTVSAVATLLLLPAMSRWKSSSGRLAGAITFVSLISYSMYLLNFTPVQEVFLPTAMRQVSTICWRCGHSLLLEYLLYWTMTVTGSYLLFRWFEQPTTALREIWFPRDAIVVTAYPASTSQGTGSASTSPSLR